MSVVHALTLAYRAERRPLRIGAVRLRGVRPAVMVICVSLALWRLALLSESPGYLWLLAFSVFLGLFIVGLLNTISTLRREFQQSLLAIGVEDARRGWQFLLERLISTRVAWGAVIVVCLLIAVFQGADHWLWAVALTGTALSGLFLGVLAGCVGAIRPQVLYASVLGVGSLIVWTLANWGGPARPYSALLLLPASIPAVSAWALRRRLGRLVNEALQAQAARRELWSEAALLDRAARLLLRFRRPVGAFIFRQYQTRRRSAMAWGRWAQNLLLLLLFPWLASLLWHVAGCWLDEGGFLLAYVSAVFFLSAVDGSTAPFGAEGSRAQAWALAPIAIGQVIRARWICYAAPLVCTAALA
ncbi:MAG TPA: hypothetical protein VLV83_20480, partial [Acidobacteriota bacterium]|nr:hypothetical protein [Acidobacteriota bacterium]